MIDRVRNSDTVKGSPVSENRRIFIGDVHGHYDGLMTLLESVAPSDADQVYFLGDLIDRGPNSAAVVDFVANSRHTCLLGNHEQMLLEAFPGDEISYSALQAWLCSGGQSTVMSYDQSSNQVLFEHLKWMRSLPTHLDLGDVWLAHAGVNPRVPLAEHTPQEYCWVRDEFHSIETPYFPDKVIITGHTITFTLPDVPPGAIAKGPGWLDIDTGAYHPRSGWLTALDYTNEKVYQVNVFSENKLRVLPLDEATFQIAPDQVAPRRRKMFQNQIIESSSDVSVR